MNIYGIVLASGYSKRMGEQKLVLPWGGKTIFDQVLEAAKKSKLNGIYSVVPSECKSRTDISIQQRVNLIFNKASHLGMGNSLALAVDNLPKETDAVIILLADQPEISPTDINATYNHFFRQHPSEKVIIRTHYKDDIKGHPILFSKHFFSEISRLEGDVGAKHIIQKYSDSVINVKSINEYPQDIDTPTDYVRLISKR